MHRSDIARGLAVSAVAALALAGLPQASHANPINDQVGNDNVVLYSQSSGTASLKADGANETVRLEAGAGANISQVTFQYRVGAGAWVDIQTVSRNDNGAFSAEWTPLVALVGNPVDIRAIASPDGAVVTDEDTAAGVQISGNAESVDLANGDTVGVYQSPHAGTPQNVILGGTTSVAGASVDVSHADGAATVNVTSDADKKFTAVLNIAGDYTYGASDELVVSAESGSDDVEAYSLYKQVVTTVTATPKATQVPNGGSTDVKIVVTDQNGKPIAGAEVAEGSTVIGLTGADGSITTTQGEGTKSYHANVTAGSPAFNAVVGDKKSADVTVTEYLAGVADIVGASKDGNAFDLDENVAGDITVDVVDSNGASFDPAAAQNLKYRWVITPFDGSAVVNVPGPLATDTTTLPDTLGNSKFDIPLPGTVEGTYELYASLAANSLGNGAIAEKKVLTFKTGEAEVEFDAESPQSGLIGSTVDVKGKLVLDDGTALSGREFTASYASTGNAALVAVTGVRKTDANGAFSVSVKDAATPVTTELGGALTVTAAAPNADATNVQDVDFVTDQVPTGAVLTTDLAAGTYTPGDVVDVDVVLEDKDGNPLQGVQVELAADHGYFTDGNAVAPVAGAYTDGEYTDLGETVTVVTDATGQADIEVAMGRDAGFDDNGLVDQAVSAEVDGVSDADEVEWDSTNPYHVSEVSVVRTPDARQNGPVDPAPVGNLVAYDIFAKDQFGNLARGVNVDVDCPVDVPEDDPGCPTGGWSEESNFDNGGDLFIGSGIAGEFEFVAVAENVAEVFGTNVATTEVLDREAEFTQEWYEIDYAASTYTIDRTPAGAEVDLDATVVETVTVVDQEGNPIEGLIVDFVRSGDTNETRFETNEAGQASYVFRATELGSETVTAVVRLGDGTILETLEDTMTVGGGVAPKVFIEGANAKGKDKLTVFSAKRDADLVAGMDVDLYKKVDGEWKRAGNRDAVMGQNGVEVFVVKDRNGNKVTAYRAIVDGGNVTKTIRQR